MGTVAGCISWLRGTDTWTGWGRGLDCMHPGHMGIESRVSIATMMQAVEKASRQAGRQGRWMSCSRTSRELWVSEGVGETSGEANTCATATLGRRLSARSRRVPRTVHDMHVLPCLYYSCMYVVWSTHSTCSPGLFSGRRILASARWY